MNGNVFINTSPLQKENLCTVFRTFPTSVGSQWPLTQNNPYTKRHILGQCVFIPHILPFETSFFPLGSFMYQRLSWQLQRDWSQGLQDKRSAMEERKQTQIGIRVRKQKMTNLNALPILMNQSFSPGTKLVQLNRCISLPGQWYRRESGVHLSQDSIV